MDSFDVYSNNLLLLRIARNLDLNSRSFYCFISWELKNMIALYVAIFTDIYTEKQNRNATIKHKKPATIC